MRRALVPFGLAFLLLAGVSQAQIVTTIYDIQQDAFASGDHVVIENVIVTGVDAEPSGYGFWVQEAAGGPHSALYVFVGTGAEPATAIGDLVDVEGMYDDYYGLAELNLAPAYGGFGSYTVTGTSALPAPELLRAWQTKTSNPLEAEQWECVLVKVENLTALDLAPGYGEWFAEEFDFAVNDTTRFDDGGVVSGPPPGTQMSSITGVLHYAYSEFKITPQTDSDIVYIGAAPAPDLLWACATGESSVDVRFDREVTQATAENIGNYLLDAGAVSGASLDVADDQLVHLTLAAPMTPELFLTLTVIGVQNTDGIPMSPKAMQFWGGLNSLAFAQAPDAGGDSSAVAGDVITITGVVHSKYDVYGSHVYLQEVNRGDYNGIEIYLTSLLPDIEIGDMLVLADGLGEYFNMTSMTEPFLYYEKVSSGNTVLAPEEISVVDPIPANYEIYEGALVEVKNVVVVERAGGWNFFDWSVTQDELNWLKIGGMGDYDYQSSLGDTLNIRGTMRYDFGEFKIMPRSDADIEVIYSNPIAVPGMPAGVATALGQNFPNPFNPSTKITFRLGTPGAAELTVFDPQGRVVKSLHTGELGAGDHQVTWQGDTDSGGLASSGVYFYRLQTADGSITKRMVLLK